MVLVLEFWIFGDLMHLARCMIVFPFFGNTHIYAILQKGLRKGLDIIHLTALQSEEGGEDTC